jgi:membrane protease YdiL (CAAX protease family)
MPILQIYRYILIGLSGVLLVCALKNYIVFIFNGNEWCEFLCPSVFGWNDFTAIPLLEDFFKAQEWLLASSQELADEIFFDERRLFGLLIAAPVIEEMIYRGPVYLTRRYSNQTFWWLCGIALTVVFVLSHEINGIAILPLLVLGVYNLWLVSRTQRLWPAIVLHFLYNFIISSYSIYPTIWAGD